jgi:endonuclease/exonuclease/phosphatase (EEP) superfamily protein YafD
VLLLAVPAVALTLVTLAAFFGRWSWLLDVLANFRPQYVVVLGAMAAILFLGRWRKTAGIALAGALVNAVVVVPLFWGGGTTVPPEEPLTVLSFNLRASNDRFGDVVEYIRSVDADVVFLHEVSRPWEVAIESAGLGYQVTKSRSEELIFGTLVLSQSGDEVTSFGFTLEGARAVEVIHDGVAMLGIHTLAPTTEERSGLRNAQLEFAGEWASEQERAHLVTGDFNSTPWTYGFRRLQSTTGLRNSQRGFGIEASFPTVSFFAFRVPIDHLLHSEELVVTDRRLGPALGSDHFPLIVDLWVPGSVEE